ncbi:hypothetical protein EXA83_15435 [Salmonella enterica subsp. enterica serovar Breukelen]|nr:hypothetical protein [Salmonella enterica subsp. enterica serovar Breukelen]EIV7065312.1 hypothetical protein [Salmonella enterica]
MNGNNNDYDDLDNGTITIPLSCEDDTDEENRSGWNVLNEYKEKKNIFSDIFDLIYIVGTVMVLLIGFVITSPILLIMFLTIMMTEIKERFKNGF